MSLSELARQFVASPLADDPIGRRNEQGDQPVLLFNRRPGPRPVQTIAAKSGRQAIHVFKGVHTTLSTSIRSATIETADLRRSVGHPQTPTDLAYPTSVKSPEVTSADRLNRPSVVTTEGWKGVRLVKQVLCERSRLFRSGFHSSTGRSSTPTSVPRI